MKLLYWGQKTIRPADAKKILEENNVFAGQRPLRAARIEMLKRKMEQGLFRGGELAFGRLKDGTRVLVNGQHQLAAAIELGTPIKAMVQEFECDSEQDLARCYTQFDIVPRRTEREIVQAFASGRDDNMQVEHLQVALRALTYLVGHNGPAGSGFERTTRTGLGGSKAGQVLLPDERAELLNTYRTESMFAIDTVFPGDRADAETKFMRRSGSVAAMMVTFRKHRTDAKTFWQQVRDGEGLARTSPAARLRDYLMSTKADKGGGTRAEMYAKSLAAWNAWRQGRELQVLKTPSSFPLPL